MQIGQYLKIKMWDPKVLFRSIRKSADLWFGAGTSPTQLELNGVPCTSVKTVKKTIGHPGCIESDFTWTSAANTTAQNKDLGSIVPAFARVLDVKLVTEETHTGAVSLAVTAGNASAGSEFVATGASYTLNDVRACLHAIALNVAPVAAASKVWIGGTPGANWSLMTAGRLAVYVTYIETV